MYLSAGSTKALKLSKLQSKTKKCHGETAQWKLTTWTVAKTRFSCISSMARSASFRKRLFFSDQEWLKKHEETARIKTCWRSTPTALGLQMCKAHKGTTCTRCTTAVNQKHLRVVDEIKVTELTRSPPSVLCVVMFSRVF